MERLTAVGLDYNSLGYLDSGVAYRMNVLSEYEDTGLTPEEIQNDIRVYTEMWENKLNFSVSTWQETAKKLHNALQVYKDAEEQGLLIKLPCKVGDIVYANKKCLLNWYMFMETKPYVKCKVVNIKRTKTRTEINLRPLTERTHNSRYHKFFGVSAIGKTVFLTREEAETALRKEV